MPPPLKSLIEFAGHVAAGLLDRDPAPGGDIAQSSLMKSTAEFVDEALQLVSLGGSKVGCRLSVEQLGDAAALLGTQIRRVIGVIREDRRRLDVEDVVQADSKDLSHSARDLEVGTLDRVSMSQTVQRLRVDEEAK